MVGGPPSGVCRVADAATVPGSRVMLILCAHTPYASRVYVQVTDVSGLLAVGVPSEIRMQPNGGLPVSGPSGPACALCGAHLARDNTARVCAPCQRRTRAAAADPGFWAVDPLAVAVTSQDMGAVLLAYRHHPDHGGVAVPQRLVAAWRGGTQAQVSPLEDGRNKVSTLDGLGAWGGV